MARRISEGIGTGLTARTKRLQVLDGSGADDAEDALEFFRGLDRLNEPWGKYAKLIERARARYNELKMELPSDPKLRAKLTQSRQSEYWYLQQAVRFAKLVEKYLEVRPWEAVSLAMETMELLTELSFKEAHEADALEGEKMRKGRKAAALSRRKQPLEERVVFVVNLVEEGVSKRQAMERAAEHFGVSYGAISKDCYSKK